MKIRLCLLSVLAALPLAAEPATNTLPAINELAAIPDATHRPEIITNSVIIAGEQVTYTAETGMLPVLKTDGTSRASVFYVAYTRQGATNSGTTGDVLFQWRSGIGVALAALGRAGPAPRQDEPGRLATGPAVFAGGQ